jgi:hypothetical protein
LADLGPERRLHPCTNCRYLAKGARRREHACPSLLLCCRYLHGISSEVFYKHVTIVVGVDYHSQPYYFRSYPTPDRDKDVLSVLAARTSILPRIRNLELMISRTIQYRPRSGSTYGDIVFRSNWDDLPTVLSSFISKLPNLDALSYTFGLGALPNEALCIWPHAETTQQIHRSIPDEEFFEGASTWPVPLSRYCSLLPPLQMPEVAVTRLRLWLTGARMMELRQLSMVLGGKSAFGLVVREELADPMRQFWSVHHPFAKMILQMPQLRVLDVYVPEAPYLVTDPYDQGNDPPVDKAMAARLTRSLEVIFPHVSTVRLWRARSENVTSGNYTEF